MALTKDDLQSARSVVRDETARLATKDDLAATETRLSQKIETEIEGLAAITKREFDRVHQALNVYVRRVEKVEERVEKLAHHVGYTLER